jgi:hypothetical protein
MSGIRYFLYADDAALLFDSREDLVVMTRYLYSHFIKLGLLMHSGTGDTKSKTSFIYCPDKTENYSQGDTSNICLGGGKTITSSEEMSYLGSRIHYSLSCEADVIHRIKQASSAMGALRPTLKRKDLKLEVKGKIYVALVLSILLYGSESWCLLDHLMAKLRVFHATCVRSMCRATLKHTFDHHISTEDLLSRLGIQNMDYYYNNRLLGWAGHIARMPLCRLPRKFLTSWVNQPRPIGHPRMTWGQTLEKALGAKNIPLDFKEWSAIAANRNRWRKLVRLTPDEALGVV